MRLLQTGTGPGEIVGRGCVEFHAERGRAIQSCNVSWDGDSALIPFLPGVAFDQYFPNLRMVPRDGTMLFAKDAQQTELAEFQDWVLKARQRLDHEQTCPRFGTLPFATPDSGEQVAERADYVVRLNAKKARLWSETSYSSSEAHDALFPLIYRLLWDWVVSNHRAPGFGASMLTALSQQFEYYRLHGIPSDFLMRQIGRAPFAAWQAHVGSSAAEIRPGGS